jgi:hypothetical protein
MCPVCIATAAWIVASATSTGGASALLVKKLRNKNQEPTINNNHDRGENNGQE